MAEQSSTEYNTINDKIDRLKHKISIFNRAAFGGKKVVLLDTAGHGNLGDQAINAAERRFIHENFTEYKFMELSHRECTFGLKALKKSLHKDDIVMVQGGGFLGTLWPEEYQVIESILEELKNFRIIIFPQTAYFSSDDNETAEKFRKLVSDCSDLTICLREQRSYDIIKDLNLPCRLLLMPDIVLSLSGKKQEVRTNGKILLCLRDDKEKTTDTQLILKTIADSGREYDSTNTVVGYRIDAEHTDEEVKKKIDEFSNYDLVICDRLHGMIFSLLAGTPCIAFDNVSRKISGVYEWIKNINSVVCITDKELNTGLIESMIKKGHSTYDSSAMKPYWEQIKYGIRK